MSPGVGEEGLGPLPEAGQYSRPSCKAMGGSLVSPDHTEWSLWAYSQPEEIAGVWAGCGALSEKGRNKSA